MADAPNHLYLVDGSSYIFRAYHRLPPLTNRHGTPAGAVYGYTAMLWKLADGLNKADGPTHMAVILDASESTHRNQMYDQYKAHRPPPHDDPLVDAAQVVLDLGRDSFGFDGVGPYLVKRTHAGRIAEGVKQSGRTQEERPC